MATDSAVAALRRARTEDSAKKQNAVLATLDRVVAQGTEVSISTVARESGVSRQFIYTHRPLREAITNASAAATELVSRNTRGPDMAAGLRADRRILAAKIERQATTIAELNDQVQAFENQRQRWLGSQLNRGATIDPEAHAELRITNERLMAENMALVAQIAELRRITTILEADLAASRQAHAEDVASLNASSTDVTVLDHRPLRTDRTQPTKGKRRTPAERPTTQ